MRCFLPILLMIAFAACDRERPAQDEGAQGRASGAAQAASGAASPADLQIAEAVSPLPEAMRSGATVLGYDGSGGLAVLRAGDGAMRCLADDPTDDRWHVACYHGSLEPFMARGRELRARGMEREELERIREEEIESGALPFPDHPAALYSLTGDPGSFDPETGRAPEARALHVLYVPYATPEGTGLTVEPSRDRPWLMAPGRPWAHVMNSG